MDESRALRLNDLNPDVRRLLEHPDICGVRAYGSLVKLLLEFERPRKLTLDQLVAHFATGMLLPQPDGSPELDRFRANHRAAELPAASRAGQVASVLAAAYSSEPGWCPAFPAWTSPPAADAS